MRIIDDKLQRYVMRIPFFARISLRFSRPESLVAASDTSSAYWERRYAEGGNSGTGSYGKFALFKAEFLNSFVKQHHVKTVIEYGCGDGNQLSLAEYQSYLGFDVSPTALKKCCDRFSQDKSKRFKQIGEFDGECADLTLSLDVIFHLIEDEVYELYMRRLFDTTNKFVIVYSSDTDDIGHKTAPHVHHRRFTRWVEAHQPRWSRSSVFKNAFPYQGEPDRSSFADFYVFERISR
jgi:hypothetical protein